MVTHDIAEALLLADRIVVLIDGRIRADAAPAALARQRAIPDVRAMVDVPRRQAERLAALVSPALAEALAELPALVRAHLLLSGCAVGDRRARRPAAGDPRRRAAARVRTPVLGLAGLIQTIPALALLALFYPALLILGQATGLAIPALGFLPALIALSLYALLPILRNGVAALQGHRSRRDRGGRRARHDPAPAPDAWSSCRLGAPVILAGIRTAAVWTIGAATLATTVGQPSLGNLIFSGLQTENWVRVLTGCAAAAGARAGRRRAARPGRERASPAARAGGSGSASPRSPRRSAAALIPARGRRAARRW